MGPAPTSTASPGLCAIVGIGGHISEGSFGTMSRAHGVAADHVTDAHVVMLDRASMGLFWAIRGGGGANFGVMTAYKVDLVTVPSMVTVFNVNRTRARGAARPGRCARGMGRRLFLRVFATGPGSAFQALFLGAREELVETMAYYAGYMNGEPVEALLNRSVKSGYLAYKAKSDYVRKAMSEATVEAMFGWLAEEVLVFMDPLGGGGGGGAERRMDEVAEAEIPFRIGIV
ncbi:hypothetical protein QJS10_CPB21g01062 [Acorus calamus]|uniref:Uncharacterized protein n=1 Tax=Acorus calamus TaxID=4465 RepID=A0AAV9C2Z6_ACOCL|nr:hypothetical protein QJS10_CPB21g01062 [Acorus calamus]